MAKIGDFMLKMFQIEFITVLSRRYLFFLSVIFLFFLSFNIYDTYNENDYHNNWKNKVKNDIKVQKYELSKKGNTDEIKKYIIENIKKNKMYLSENINPYEKNQYTFMQKNLNFLAFIPIFILFMSSFVIFKEYKYNVIKNIKLSTTTSFQIIISKFIAMVVLVSLFFLVTYVITFFIGIIINQFTSFNYEIITQKQNIIESKNAFVYISQIFFSDYIVSIFLISFIFMMISLTKSSSLSLLISISLLVLHKNISTQLSFLPWTKYLFFNTLNFRDELVQTTTFDVHSEIVILFILTIIYILFFLSIS
ncbi:ABC transporter permease, partial [Staphylococcus felis]